MVFDFGFIEPAIKKIAKELYRPNSPFAQGDLVRFIVTQEGVIKLQYLASDAGYEFVKESPYSLNIDVILDVTSLLSIVQLFDGEVNVQIKDNEMIVFKDNKKISVSIIDFDFYFFTNIDTSDQDVFRHASYFNEVKHFTSFEKIDSVLSAVCFFNRDGRSYCVGADRFMAALIDIGKEEEMFNDNILIHNKTNIDDKEYVIGSAVLGAEEYAQEWDVFLYDGAGEREYVYIRPLANRNYPLKVYDILRDNPEYFIEIDRQKIDEFLLNVNKLFGGKITHFAMFMEGNELSLHAYLLGTQRYVETMSVNTNLNKLRYGFNIKKFKNFISFGDSDKLYIKTDGKKFLLNSDNYTTLIMPVELG